MLTVFSPISYKLFLQVNLLFGEHGEYMLCTEIILNVKNNFCTQQVLSMFWNGIFMYWTCNSMNNLLSYCRLVDAKIRASDKGLPVMRLIFSFLFLYPTKKGRLFFSLIAPFINREQIVPIIFYLKLNFTPKKKKNGSTISVQFPNNILSFLGLIGKI